MKQDRTDVLIIGGGPAGSCAAIDLARRGYTVDIIDKDHHPRFHVGESLLPSVNPLLDGLGLTQTLSKLPTVAKLGAEIVGADQQGTGTLLYFKDGKRWGHTETFNIERSVFDHALIQHAAGLDNVRVHQGVAAKTIERLGDGDCAIATNAGTMHARLVLDCSGQATVLGRHFGTKRPVENHRKVAFTGHFTGVDRLEADAPWLHLTGHGQRGLVLDHPHR